MPMLTDAHMGNLEWQAYRVVPSREGMQNPVSAKKAEADVPSDLCTICVHRDFSALNPFPDPYHESLSFSYLS